MTLLRKTQDLIPSFYKIFAVQKFVVKFINLAIRNDKTNLNRLPKVAFTNILN